MIFISSGHSGYRSIVGVPLMREGIAIGVIILTRPVVQPFSEKQIELITTFADQAVIAIENVRLFDEVQQRTAELSESLQQQTAISEILRVISNSPSDVRPVSIGSLSHGRPASARRRSWLIGFTSTEPETAC